MDYQHLFGNICSLNLTLYSTWLSVKNCLTTFISLMHSYFPYVPKELSKGRNCTRTKTDNQLVSHDPVGHFMPQCSSVTSRLPWRPYWSWKLCIRICKTFVLVFYLPENKISIWMIAVLLQWSESWLMRWFSTTLIPKKLGLHVHKSRMLLC